MINQCLLITFVQFPYSIPFIFVAYIPCLPDCKSGKCIKVIDPMKDLKSKGLVSWISCVALDASESWLVRTYLL